MISIAEETATRPSCRPQASSPKPTKRPVLRHRAPTLRRRRASRPRRPPRPRKRPKAKESHQSAREGSKTDQVLELLKRPGGVTAKELMKVTGWQPHSVRGFLSGTIGKKMGLTVTSTKGEDGERSYSVKA